MIKHITVKTKGQGLTEFTAEVECETDSSGKKWRKTQVWMSGDPADRRVTRIMLKGEKVAYVFK